MAGMGGSPSGGRTGHREAGMSDAPSLMRLELVSQPELLAPVRAMLTSLSERLGFDEVETGHLALAVDEALANVIRHGYDNATDGRIWISARVVDEPTRRLQIEIEDQGRQIDPAMIRPRDLDDVRPGGLGVHLMREVTDSCEFERRTPAGMRLVLEKSIPTSRSPGRRDNKAGTPENGTP